MRSDGKRVLRNNCGSLRVGMQLVGPDGVFAPNWEDVAAVSNRQSANEKWRKKGFGKQFDENEGDNVWKQQSRRMALYIACNTE